MRSQYPYKYIPWERLITSKYPYIVTTFLRADFSC